jgi:hypothetical protein
MDDRFDQILVSDYIINGTDKVAYINGSYTAVGQDGLHFNQSLISLPQNTSVPPDVLNALYNMSDHLPVTLDLKISSSTTSFNYNYHNSPIPEFNNPVNEILDVYFGDVIQRNTMIRIFTSMGELISQNTINPGDNNFKFDLSGFPSGVYFFTLFDMAGNSQSHKLLKL